MIPAVVSTILGLGGYRLAFMAGWPTPATSVWQRFGSCCSSMDLQRQAPLYSNHSSSHGMRREAGPPGVPWLGGILVSPLLQPFVWHALRFGLLSLWALQPPASLCAPHSQRALSGISNSILHGWSDLGPSRLNPLPPL